MKPWEVTTFKIFFDGLFFMCRKTCVKKTEKVYSKKSFAKIWIVEIQTHVSSACLAMTDQMIWELNQGRDSGRSETS